MSLGKNIIKYRKARKMTAAQLAERCGIKQPYMSEIENDKKIPLTPLLVKIANELGTSTDILLGEESNKFDSNKLDELKGDRSYEEYASYLSNASNVPITALILEQYIDGNVEPPKSILLKICKVENKDLNYFYTNSVENQDSTNSNIIKSDPELFELCMKIKKNNIDVNIVSAYVDGLISIKK